MIPSWDRGSNRGDSGTASAAPCHLGQPTSECSFPPGRQRGPKRAGTRILIIKTGHTEFHEPAGNGNVVSLGDVLRTTPLLRLYEGCDVTWVTDPYAVPLLAGVPQITRLMAFGPGTVATLRGEVFDQVINLEKAPPIVDFAGALSAERFYGFLPGRCVTSAGRNGTVWPGRRGPTRTGPPRPAQRQLFEIVGAEWCGEEYLLGVPPAADRTIDVCLNTGVGRKWPTKRWPPEHWDALERLLRRRGLTVARQDKQDGGILTSIPRYIDWVNAARVIVTADTLGLHLGIALGKQVVGLFGPTPPADIHFYGRGRALLPEPLPDCAPCLSATCPGPGTCMDRIEPGRVFRCACHCAGAP